MEMKKLLLSLMIASSLTIFINGQECKQDLNIDLDCDISALYNHETERGWDRLPSGLIMKWGYGSLGSTGTTTFDLNFGPAFKNAFNAQVNFANLGSHKSLAPTLELAKLNKDELCVNAGTGSGRKVYYFVLGN